MLREYYTTKPRARDCFDGKAVQLVHYIVVRLRLVHPSRGDVKDFKCGVAC